MSQTFMFRDEMGRQRAANLVANLPLDGRQWKLVWQEAKEKRRDAQNRLLWMWNGQIQAHMRDSFGQVASAEDWHDILCRRLMPAEVSAVSLPGSDACEVGRWRSSKAGVREMAEYLNLLDAYCAENLGLLLPHPQDMYHEAMSRRAA